MSVLVIAEHDNSSLNPGTACAVAAASQLDQDVVILVAGSGCHGAADQAAALQGVTKVLVSEDESYKDGLAEPLADLVVSMAENYSHILVPASTYGKNVMPRVAALLDVAQISDVIEVIDAETFKRPFYAGNAIATVRSKDRIKVLTVRTTGFDAVSAEGGQASVESIDAQPSTGVSRFVSREQTESDRPDLGSARIVISGGRALGSGEKFTEVIETLADKLGAAVGASRAAVDAGYVPNDYQVGQTGKIVAPDLYIAIGISGAIQHLAGMQESKVIVAINKDEEAPIFEIADYGLVADLFEVVPQLIDALD